MKKLWSRKLLAFLVASGLFAAGVLSEDGWTISMAVYVGAQGLVDALGKLKGAPDAVVAQEGE